MEKFEIQNGMIGVTDEEIQIEANALIGIKRLYNRRRLVLFSVALVWILFLIIAYYSDNIYYQGLAIFLVLFVAFYTLSLIFARFGITSSMKTIPRESIKDIEYDSNGGLRVYRLHIKYAEDDEEKSKSVWVSLFGANGGDRLRLAVQTLESVGMEPKQA